MGFMLSRQTFAGSTSTIRQAKVWPKSASPPPHIVANTSRTGIYSTSDNPVRTSTVVATRTISPPW
eukprot:350686-Chlamydomonas_euryale.AAC.1